MNRACQRQTLGLDFPVRRMICTVPKPLTGRQNDPGPLHVLRASAGCSDPRRPLPNGHGPRRLPRLRYLCASTETRTGRPRWERLRQVLSIGSAPSASASRRPRPVRPVDRSRQGARAPLPDPGLVEGPMDDLVSRIETLRELPQPSADTMAAVVGGAEKPPIMVSDFTARHEKHTILELREKHGRNQPPSREARLHNPQLVRLAPLPTRRRICSRQNFDLQSGLKVEVAPTTIDRKPVRRPSAERNL